MGSRLSGVLPGRRIASILATMSAAGAITAGGARADQLVTATVYSSTGKSTDSVSLQGLESNPGACPRYSGSPGMDVHPANPGQTFTAQAWTLAQMLECFAVPIQPVQVTAITVYQSNGIPEAATGSQLARPDLTVPSDFQDTTAVPVIYSDGTNLDYYRPWRGGADNNAKDLVQNPAGLQLDIFEGPPIEVTASASQSSVTAGATVAFTARATATGGTGFAYSWNFDGGARDATGQSTDATFASPGNYRVTVEVTDSQGGGGLAIVPVTVNGQSTTPPTSSTPQSTPHGPQGTKGSTPGGTTGGHPSGVPGGSGTAPNGHSGTDHSGANGPTASTTPTAKTAPHTTPTSTSASRASPSGASAAPSRRAAAQVPRAPAAGAARGEHASRPGAVGPRLVSGLLISDVATLPAGASPLVHLVSAAAAPAPPVRLGRD